MKEYKAAVFIGRFQPFHNVHLDIVKQGLEIADKVIVLVGSANAARSVKNPFTLDERKEMIRLSVGHEGIRSVASPLLLSGPVIVEGVRDYYYNLNTWIASVQAIVSQHVDPGDSVALLGAFKDASSYYLKSFPQWTHVGIAPGAINSTDLREALYSSPNPLQPPLHKLLTDYEGKVPERFRESCRKAAFAMDVPAPVKEFVADFTATKEFANLVSEWRFNNEYRKSWESSPFPPTFVTADALVECSGHVLVVRRGFNPGKGLYALPGGFVKQDELIQDAALRELKEETRIRVNKVVLEKCIVKSQVFDHPERSLRGRTITHGFHIRLNGELPEVKGGDDADKAMWMPLWDVVRNEEKFFEDHAHIINFFTGVS